MKPTYLLLIFLMGGINITAQNYTLSGYITDQQSGERLINATLYAINHEKGTTTNEYGFFSLTLPKGTIELKVSYVGFQIIQRTLVLTKNTPLNIALTIATTTEIVVSDKTTNNRQRHTSTINLPISQIEALPKLLGETDVLRALALTPGISTGYEGSTGLFVRGGTPDQNLILLDHATVYNAAHLFGFLSIFNTDALKNVELIKGGFPARYGGRLSSILDITMKEGNRKKEEGKFSIGLLSSKILWESPLGDRASYLVSARAAYWGIVGLPWLIAYETGGSDQYLNYNLFDINAKINYQLKDDSQLYWSIYTGNDFFNTAEGTNVTENKLNLDWGNITSSVRYQKAFSPKLFGQGILSYTRYHYKLSSESSTEIPTAGINEKSFLSTTSSIQDIAAKFRLDYLPNPSHYIKTGGEIIRHRFAPSIYRSSILNEANSPQNSTIVWNTEFAAFVEDEIQITDRFSINAGVRYSALRTNKKWYGGFEPRLASSYLLGNNWSVKASYSVMQQYIHLLTNNGTGIPNDIWVPVTDKIPPQRAEQLSIGINKYFEKSNIEVSLEAYNKRSLGLIDYEEGANFLFDFSTDWQDIVETNGQGEAYGIEFFLHKKRGRWNGWFGYTLAWNNRLFNTINQGNWYPAKYDKRHDIEAVFNYKINKKWDFSASWIYSTGAAITMPTAQYQSSITGYLVSVYNERNGQRFPAAHRLDFGFTYHKNARSTWEFGLYNAYSQKNPFYIERVASYSIYESNTNNSPIVATQPFLIQRSLFPILPSVSYSFKFR